MKYQLPPYAQKICPYASTVLEVPEVHHITEMDPVPNISAITYRGADCAGKETRVFAYLGFPEGATAEKPVPAVVLVHGGGHTGCWYWVKYWTDRGYAAISMDLEGHYGISNGSYCMPTTEPNEYSGPDRKGVFNDADIEDITQQWPYHAVSAIMIARTLIGSYDVVDDSRVGIMGFSWGGYLTSFTITVDNRYAFAVPVYGCAFMKENHVAKNQPMTSAQEKWDPTPNLSNISAKVLWFNSDKDFFTTFIGNTLSYENVPGSVMLLDTDMRHGGGNCWSRPEPFAFADSVVFGKPGFIEFTTQPEGLNPTAIFTVPVGVTPVSAKVYYRTKEMPFPPTIDNTDWVSADATLDTVNNTVSATLPNDTKYYYLRIFDNRVGHDEFMKKDEHFSSTSKVVIL